MLCGNDADNLFIDLFKSDLIDLFRFNLIDRFVDVRLFRSAICCAGTMLIINSGQAFKPTWDDCVATSISNSSFDWLIYLL